jgi:hypothetical protein
LSRLADARTTDLMPEDMAEQEAKRAAVVYRLLCIVISAMLVVGAIASIVIAFG